MALDDYGGDKWWVNNIREVYQAVVWGYIGLGEVHVLPFSVPMQYVTQVISSLHPRKILSSKLMPALPAFLS